MPASDFQRKALTFVIFTGIVALLLFSIPFAIEPALNNYLVPNGWFLNAQGNIVALNEGTTADLMTATSNSLIENALRFIKILLWMGLVISLVRFVANLILSTVRGSKTEVFSLAKTVLSIIVYIVAFFIIFQTQYPAIELAPLFTGSAILGIVVGLALQDTLGNLFAGIALQADQPFQVGDVVTFMNQQSGVVEGVSWRGVKIRTFQNKVLVISNSVLGKEMIEVAPRGNLNARLIVFNTLYTNSPTKTIQLIRDAVRQVENVSQKIRPVVRVRNLGDNGLDFEIKYWAEDYSKYMDTDALIRQRVWYVFQREGIDFAYPTRTLHIVEKQEETPFVEYVTTVAEHLQQVPLFTPLAEEELERLAKASTTRVFAPGEAIVRRGQEGNSMFVIIRGAVKVQIPENDYQKTINKLTSNDFFGEMSLLTGQPRTATVIAEQETEVVQIKKTALKPLFEMNPDLMKSICNIIEERRELLVQKEDEEEQAKESTAGVLSSLRKFFGFR